MLFQANVMASTEEKQNPSRKKAMNTKYSRKTYIFRLKSQYY